MLLCDIKCLHFSHNLLYFAINKILNFKGDMDSSSTSQSVGVALAGEPVKVCLGTLGLFRTDRK